MADHNVIGKTGEVVTAIPVGGTGEVFLPVRGGSEAFYAYSSEDYPLPVGTPVVVYDQLSPRTVEVAAVKPQKSIERR